jgi:hypothetical protein
MHADELHTIGEGSLDYGGVPNAGNKAVLVSTEEFPGFELRRRIASPITEADHGVLWVSFLVRKINASEFGELDSLTIRLHPPVVFGETPTSTSSRPVDFGVLGDAFNSDTEHKFGIRRPGFPIAESFSSRSIELSSTFFVVGRLDFNTAGSESFSLFVNPATNTLPTSPDATLQDFFLSSVAFIDIVGGDENTRWEVDEIRAGTTYFDVVPEPSTALSLTLGLGLLASRRRRSGAAGG